MTDVDVGRGTELADELGVNAAFLVQDVSDAGRWGEVVAAAEERFGRLDALVNNGAYHEPASLMDATVESWQRHIDVNETGVFHGMRAVVPAIHRAGGGSIVNICSTAALKGTGGLFAYTASKWALRGMSRAAARELAPLNIRVNAVFPGLTRTAMMDRNGEEANARYVQAIPLARPAEPSEIAEAVAFLISGGAKYVNGAEIVIDGGSSA